MNLDGEVMKYEIRTPNNDMGDNYEENFYESDQSNFDGVMSDDEDLEFSELRGRGRARRNARKSKRRDKKSQKRSNRQRRKDTRNEKKVGRQRRKDNRSDRKQQKQDRRSERSSRRADARDRRIESRDDKRKDKAFQKEAELDSQSKAMDMLGTDTSNDSNPEFSTNTKMQIVDGGASEEGMSKGLKIGMIVGGVVLLGVIGLVVAKKMKK